MSENSTLYKRHFASAQESLDAITQLQDHNSFKLAFADNGFLMQDELRHVRLQLEYLKPQMVLEQHGINATIVVFGSARFLSPSVAASQLAEVQQRYAGQEHTAEAVSALQQAQRDVRNSQYYAASQAFA
ncbi:MAG: 3-isopropylmalate dehydrogenase, partial [Alishewanella sp.]|nr:3-isopropylmalate dehydrogenase [Alishewanella sp.]